MIFIGRSPPTLLTVTLAAELEAMGEADLALTQQAMTSDDVPLQQAWRRLTTAHADRQLDVQRRVLALISASPDPGVGPREIAMLRDRVLVNEGRNQVYGTQVAGVADGQPVLWPCDDPDGLAARRAEVGLPPPL